ncbi:MAG TPA: hypothetical protein VKU82_04740 [Planctomycetaceae bacterium]|nr:hypothetical protein [Planctomycetaceae bacterium]
MNRKKTLSLAAMAATMLALGGTWAMVHGQGPSVGTGSTSSAPKGRQAPNPLAPSAGYGQPMMVGQPGTAWYAPPDDDPEMRKLANDEAALAHESQEMVSRYTESDNADEQKKIKGELRDALAKQFDVQRERRELELTRIEERVRKLREQIKKRNDARDTIIDRRLDQLINEAEGLGWGPNSGQAGKANFYYSILPQGQQQPGTAPPVGKKR